ncbi:MAG: ATP synthase F1 subunit epsilon [Oscillospiraceae bacterium]|nr:ATP synthase F1 subunit epsilon [Oscillospiraceae bacterium]
MKKTFHLEILASKRPFFKGECEELIFPAIDGECGILADHEPMVSAIQSGELRFCSDGKWTYAAVSEGLIEITSQYVIILADTVEYPEEIDKNRAEEAKLRAEEQLRQKQSIREYYRTQAALNRAINRLKISQRHINKH